MFGVIGSAVGIVTSNIFVHHFPEAPVSCYTGVFIAYIIFALALLVLTQLLFRGLTFTVEEKNNDQKVNIWKLLLKAMDGNACFFVATVLMMGIQQSFYVNFTFFRLKEMKAPSLIYGFNMAVAVLASAAFFIASDFIIVKVGGNWPAMIICVFAYFVRFLAIASVENPCFIPLIQLLQAFCYGLFLTAAVLHVKSIARPDIRTTLYTILNSLHFGVGIIIANTLGGKLYKDYGARNLFLIASLTALVWAIIAILYSIIFVKFKFFGKELLKGNTKDVITLTS